MAFISKPDYFGLAAANKDSLTLKESSLNKTASLAEAHDQHGDVVAQELFGEQAAPSVTYELKGDLALSGVKLGQVHTIDGKSYVLSSLAVNTAPATVPSVQAGGELVETGATTANSTTIAAPAVSLKKWHDTQILASAFTLGGEGCYLNGCNYTIGCDVTKATVDGEVVAHDVSNGRVEVQVTIVQTSSATPTITPGEDWTLTSPLTVSNPDEDYPTWTCSLSKPLSSSHPSAA